MSGDVVGLHGRLDVALEAQLRGLGLLGTPLGDALLRDIRELVRTIEAASEVPVVLTTPGLERLTDDERAQLHAAARQIVQAAATRVVNAAVATLGQHVVRTGRAEVERDMIAAGAGWTRAMDGTWQPPARRS